MVAIMLSELGQLILLRSLNQLGRELPAEAIKPIELADAPLLGLVTKARNVCLTCSEASGNSYRSSSRAYYASSGDAAFYPGCSSRVQRSKGAP